MRTIAVQSELANGAKPKHVTIVLLTRDEVVELLEKEALIGTSEAGLEPMVIWLADDVELETEMIEGVIANQFAQMGVPLEKFTLGAD